MEIYMEYDKGRNNKLYILLEYDIFYDTLQ